jgi:hypothetical protein
MPCFFGLMFIYSVFVLILHVNKENQDAYNLRQDG